MVFKSPTQAAGAIERLRKPLTTLKSAITLAQFFFRYSPISCAVSSGFFLRHLEEWEYDEGKVTFEITLGLLQGYHLLRYVLTIKLLHRSDDRADDFVFLSSLFNIYFLPVKLSF